MGQQSLLTRSRLHEVPMKESHAAFRRLARRADRPVVLRLVADGFDFAEAASAAFRTH